MAAAEPEAAPKSFPQFALLGDELARYVFSFVAEAPLERWGGKGQFPDPPQTAPMTGTLPLVSRKFREMSDDDSLWKAALSRQLSREERLRVKLWWAGLQRFAQPDGVSFKHVYRTIVERHISVELPVFIMPCHIDLGQVYGLHLFEPRYRVMVHELLERTDNLAQSRSGRDFVPHYSDGYLEPPMLIHACRGTRFQQGSQACLVELVRCQLHEDGRADVMLRPVCWMVIDEVSIRRHMPTGHLYGAKGHRTVDVPWDHPVLFARR